jgi:uncharacterized protein
MTVSKIAPAVVAIAFATLQSGCRPPTPTEDLFDAARFSDDVRARKDLAQGADVEARDDGDTPLMVAAKVGSLEVAKTLIREGAKLSDRGEYGQTPLIMAAGGDNSQVVSLLVSSKSDLEAKETSSTHSNALLEAAILDRRDNAQILIAAGANLNATDLAGYTPLLWAAHNGDVQLSAALLSAGADVNGKGGAVYTPITAAKLGNHPEEVEFLRLRGGHS